jgi:hypothetical protein
MHKNHISTMAVHVMSYVLIEQICSVLCPEPYPV